MQHRIARQKGEPDLWIKILSRFVSELDYQSIPLSAKENTRLFLADYICSAIAGKRTNKMFNNAVEKFVFSQGGAEESTVMFGGRKVPCSKAAFLNACYSHGADMDDGNRKAMGHVGAHVFSTVLALGEKLSSSQEDMIVAINVGYDVYCRVAAAAQPGLVHRGFHSTGTAGVIACAAAAAKLKGLDENGIYNAMAISVTMASGLMIVAESGQSIKPLSPAKAAECGILAAELSESGVCGGSRPLESEKGWFHSMTDKVDYSMITSGLGEIFCINECYIKPYPSCRHTHCAIQAVLELREEYSLSAEDIESIKVYIYPNAIRIAGQIIKPETPDDSKFSIHYSTACAAVLGRFTLNELDFGYVPDEVFEVIKKIELIPDDSMESREKGIRGCKVEIECAENRKYSKTVLIPKGDPQNPFTAEDMRSKLSQCAEDFLSHSSREELLNFLLDFGKTKNKKFKGIKII